MRYALALCLALCAFSAHAATLSFTLSNQPGSTSWSLEWVANGPIGISGVALEVSTSLGPFTPAPAFLPACCEVYDPLPSGRNLLLLQAPTGQVFVPGFVQPSLLGTFAGTTDSAALVELVGAESSAGFTVLDAAGTPIPDYTITIVPEPGVVALLGLVALRLASARLRPQPCLRRKV